MRILVVNWQDIKNPHSGGAETHLHEVFGRIASMKGHSVDLLCSGFKGAPDTETIDGMQVYRVGGRMTFPLYAKRKYKQLRAAGIAAGLGDYDVVVEDLNKIPLFTRYWHPNRLVVLTHHLFGTTAFSEVSFPVALATWLLEKPIGWHYQQVPFEAVSESTAEDLVERGIPRDRITVIYNGVDLEQLTPLAGSRAAAPQFACIGRLKRYKQIDIVIRAFDQLNDPNSTLLIAGKGDDRPRLERVVKATRCMDRIRFLGYITEDEKRDLLRSSWATLLASPKEGWGIGNIETAACGTPVIAANSPGIRESVLDGKTGFLIDGDSVDSYTSAMRRLIAHPDLVEELGKNARSFAETFTWERAARDTITHLNNVVGGDAEWKS